MKRRSYILLTAAVLMLMPMLYGSALNRDFSMGQLKIPLYQKGKLEVVIFADSGKRHGDMITGQNTLIDRLLATADVDKIPDGWQQKIQKLDAPLIDVLNFWKNRYLSSDAIIFTPLCNFDRKNNLVYGDDNVLMRTPLFDLDGVGFRTNLTTKEIEISSDVRIVARRDDSDPREIISRKIPVPPQYTTVSATGDSLRFDMAHNELMLIGNVKVVDGNTTLTCDRLTIFLKSSSAQKRSKRESDTGDSSAMLKGVSRILADGEVILRRKPESSTDKSAVQTAWCEHLEYEFDSGRIILTGEEELPKLAQGSHELTGERIELLRFSRKAFVNGKCKITEKGIVNDREQIVRTIIADRANFDAVDNLNVFTGNVKVTDKDAVLTCDSMRIFLKKAQKNLKNAKKKPDNAEFSPLSGSQELDRIYCEGKVKIVTIPKAAPDAKSAPPRASTIEAKRCELDYPADKLVFHEQVRVNHKGDTLDCDRLDLFMKNSSFAGAPDKKRPSRGVALGGRAADSKTLTKVIASGNVYMKDQKSDLRTELMTLEFQELKPGTVTTPGMFATNNIQLIHIICDGKVIAGSLPQMKKAAPGRKRTLKAEHAMTYLLKNRAEFHKNVILQDGDSEIHCQDMFVFTGTPPAAATASKDKPAVEDPDADPFALEITENAAPSRIALSDGIDLEQIICKNQVVLINRDKKGKAIHAGGDTATYTVATSDIVITADAPRRPYLRHDGKIQYSDIIKGNLKTETLEGKGNIQLVTEKKAK